MPDNAIERTTVAGPSAAANASKLSCLLRTQHPRHLRVIAEFGVVSRHTVIFRDAAERARDQCRSLIAQSIARRRSEGHKVIAEPTPRFADGSVAFAPDGLRLPLRYDLAFADESGKWHSENADSHTIRFETTAHADWQGCMKITMHRLAWDYLELHCFPAPPDCDWEPLRSWFLNWFDVDEAKEPDADDLYGVVHFISDPEVASDGFKLFVDLGSAPMAALGQLLDRLVDMQVTACTFGRNDG